MALCSVGGAFVSRYGPFQQGLTHLSSFPQISPLLLLFSTMSWGALMVDQEIELFLSSTTPLTFGALSSLSGVIPFAPFFR